MKKTGELLKAEREKRNLSLHEIGMSLKINPKILKTIEEGDVKNLPAKTFLRGFVRSYAQYLRLDVDEVLRIFLEEMGPTRPEANKPIDPATAGTSSPSSEPTEGAPPAEPRSVSPSIERTAAKEPGVIDNMTGSNRFFMIVGGVFLLVVIIFVVKMLNKYQKESQTERPTVSAEENAPDALAEKAPVVIQDGGDKEAANTIANGFASTSSTSTTIGMSASGKAPLAPATTGAPTTTTTIAKAHVPVTTTTAPPPSTLPPKPVTTTTIIMVTTTLPVVTPVTTTLPPGATSTTTTKPPRAVEVIVEALNRVSIKAQLYNGKTETLELDADQVHTFKSKAPIVLEFSDGGAVSLIVNGKDREVPGTIGKPLKIKLP